MIRLGGNGSVLGLQLSRKGVTAVELKRNGEGVRSGLLREIGLTSDLLSSDPKSMGKQIRLALDEAGLKARRCVVCIPAEWVMTHSLELPELVEADVASLLDLEAERVFPFAKGELSIAVSRFVDRDENRFATLVAIPQKTLDVIGEVLRHAKLIPLSMTVGAAALLHDNGVSSSALLLAGQESLDFAVSLNGGLACLRSFDPPEELGHGEENLEELRRELKITMRRLPQGDVNRPRAMCVFGVQPVRRMLDDGLDDAPESLGLVVEQAVVDEGGMIHFAEESDLPPAATRATASYLEGERPVIEFAKPHVGVLQKRIQELLKRGLMMRVGVVLAAAALVLFALFVFRHLHVTVLERRWERIEPQVTRLESLQEQISTYRAWYDDEAKSLVMVMALTGAFPESGGAWVRSVEIEDQARVSCDGFARSASDWLQLLDALGELEGIEDLQVKQVRGQNPVQFSFSFQWRGGAHHGV